MGANIAEWVYEQAARRPESPAIVTDRQTLDYAELRRLVGVLAHFLRAQGIAPGDVVGISMAQIPLHLMVLLAVAQIGAVSLPLHTAVPRERRLLAARRFGARWVVSGRDEFALDGIGFVDLKQASLEAGRPQDYAIHPVDGDAPMRIAISSGTSGDPKGMTMSHANVAARAATTDAGASASSRSLVLDLNFIIGFRPSISALARGSALVFPPSLAPADILRAAVKHGVTHISFSPQQARELATWVSGSAPACPDLVCLRITGGRIGPDTLRLIHARLTPNVYVSYASTECGMLTYATPEMLARRPDTAGPVCEWATIEIVDAEDNPVAVEGVGQIRIRSLHQVAGYWGDDERTRRCFRDGWFYSGDLGRFDRDGLLYIEGRIDELLNIGGMKIDPADIENTIEQHPAVAEAGAFVLEAEEGDEQLAVALVLRDASDLDEVRAFAQTQLGPLAPRRYLACAALPRTATEKLKRAELAVLFAAPVTED